MVLLVISVSGAGFWEPGESRVVSYDGDNFTLQSIEIEPEHLRETHVSKNDDYSKSIEIDKDLS